MPVIVAIDAGTTGVRALVIGEAGVTVDSAYRELPQHFPRPGWVEHDPEEIWDAVTATIAEVAGRLDAPVATVGVTDQRETTVVWDRRTGRPRHRAIVWQDRRTADRCEQLEAAGVGPLVRERTGLVVDPYFSATKLEWLLRDGGVDADADLAFGTVDSWLLWRLTDGAVHATDATNASRTMLYDLTERRWSEELCDLFGVPRSCLPEVRPSSGRFGTTAATTALGPGIPVSGVAGDQQASLFGQGCVEAGMAKNTYGTGSFVLLDVGPAPPAPVEGLLTTVAWALADGTTHYAYEGAIFVTGAALQWLRDGLGIVADAAEAGALAATVPDAGGVYMVPAFSGLGSPWWDPDARGTIVGLSRGSTRAHLARAAVEAMAYQTRDVVETMRRAWAGELTELRVDGGASAMDLLLQLVADQLHIPVARPATPDTTAVGAALLAGLAEGVWSSVEEAAATWHADRRAAPTATDGDADARYADWRRAVDRSRGWARAASR